MSVVFGTAGHIDHGKTALLRALTGIDADRLPEERARGMTIDVGYAWLALPDGTEIDFVDVPGHDRLVGNMLVGAGECDAGLLVVAADDGIRAQTVEHVEILDLLGMRHGVVAITKADLLAVTGGGTADDERAAARREAELRAALADLLGPTALATWPVVAVSAARRAGLEELLARLVEVRDALPPRPGSGVRLAIDRVFVPRGQGLVVTGSLRGGRIAAGDALRLVPGDRRVRVRGIQVHRTAREAVEGGGRTALALAGVEREELERGMVLAATPAVVGTRRFDADLRLLPGERGPLRTGAEVRVHLGTDHVQARVRLLGARPSLLPGERGLARLELARPVALAAGDRLVLRRPTPPATLGGGRVLDSWPVSRARRKTAGHGALEALAAAADPVARAVALVELHGALPRARALSAAAADGPPEPALATASARLVRAGEVLLAPALAAALAEEAIGAVRAAHGANPLSEGTPLAELRTTVGRTLRREAGLGERDAADAATALLATLVAGGRLAQSGNLVRDPSFRRAFPPAMEAAMARLVAALATATPPALSAAVAELRLPGEAVRALESAGRIVRVEADLAYESATYQRLRGLALDLARRVPLSPAAYRDATGTSRKYALAILEHLDGRGELRRTPAGHILGPRARR
ncbi:MAG: selenocysteine-specific translation elongation factor [Chloroflexi bacterium GWC2_73_18]|nr:MAG: selenocysteine-specific translation elongation factor [Chloroflexi bacterium GWC2_73_18]